MHALNRISQVTGNKDYLIWAVVLAKVAHQAFTYAPDPAKPESKRMYWKMSTDLTRPLVTSMGQHDPLDGLLTYYELSASLEAQDILDSNFSLEAEITDMHAMCAHQRWATSDLLGMGGLLTDAYKTYQLIGDRQPSGFKDAQDLLEQLMLDSITSLQSLTEQNPFDLPANQRLAFRELGLSIGVQVIPMLDVKKLQKTEILNNKQIQQLTELLDYLRPYTQLHSIIESFWLQKDHQAASTWQDHLDINQVMLATSLGPYSYLQI